MDVRHWLARACEDADSRGLPELKPLLETLAASTDALRSADAEFAHPALPPDRPDNDDDDPA